MKKINLLLFVQYESDHVMVGMGTIPELSLRKVGILTLPGEVRMPTWHGSIPELSLRKVGIGTKWESIIFLR